MNEFIERFREALRIKTDWQTDEAAAVASLTQFQDFLVKTYPVFHQNTERWVLSPYSVAYRWRGHAAESAPADKPHDKLPVLPVLLVGHYDVVPAETAKWTVDPFGAEIKDGFVYSRGALDMKHIIAAMMESAENLCKRGFKPERDVWIVLGGDEERNGIKGAKETAKWFKEKEIKFSFIFDEGTPIALNQIKGINKPLALIGIEEKGYLSLNLTVEQKPGHASQPPQEQAAAVLAGALLRLSRRPFPWLLTPAVESFFKQLGFHAHGLQAFVMKHARALGPLFFKAAATTPATRALVRNTIAMTQLEGSSADNVLPSKVRAVINIRLLPPWTVEKAIEWITKVIKDERVNVSILGLGTNPTEAGPGQAEQKSPGWKEITSALNNSFPGVPALPFLMPATTDSRHYKDLSPYIFRFNPCILTPDELSRVHGHDERISFENLEYGLKFYTALFEQF